jgi:hypothetical protein
MRNRRSEHPWAIGFVFYAGIMLIMVGIFGAIQGLAAIFEDAFYVVSPNYVFEFDVTAWGWIHLLVGLLAVAAGFFLFYGHLWARIVGIAAAVLSAIANFAFIPYYPVWSVLIIALDVAVIWALAFHGGELKE